MEPERPGWYQSGAPDEALRLSGAPIAASTASASALASNTSTVRVGPVQLRGTAMLWRTPAAMRAWPVGEASLYCGPTSNSAGSLKPRASLRAAASIRLGRIEG